MLSSPFASASAQFGESLDYDGSILLVGQQARRSGTIGKNIFAYTPVLDGRWNQSAAFANSATQRLSGATSVALDGEYAVAGDAGRGYLFHRTGNGYRLVVAMGLPFRSTSDVFMPSPRWDLAGTTTVLACNGYADLFERPTRPLLADLQVYAKGQLIRSGDTTPRTADGTDMGSAAWAHFGLVNAGNALVHVANAWADGENAFEANLPLVLYSGTGAGYDLGKEPIELEVRFASTIPGVHTATIHVRSDDPATPDYTFRVQATVA